MKIFQLRAFKPPWFPTVTNINHQPRSVENLLWEKTLCKVENSLKLVLLKLKTEERSASGGSSTVLVIFIKKIDPFAPARPGEPLWWQLLPPQLPALTDLSAQDTLPQSPLPTVQPLLLPHSQNRSQPPLHHGALSFSMFPLFTESLLKKKKVRFSSTF